MLPKKDELGSPSWREEDSIGKGGGVEMEKLKVKNDPFLKLGLVWVLTGMLMNLAFILYAIRDH